jgi:hypothetical protein
MKLDLSEGAWRAHLVPPGAHLAEIADLRIMTAAAGDRVMAELALTTDTGHTVSELVTVWCDPSLHDYAAQCGRAKVLLGQLAAATGVPLPDDTDDLAAAYIGQRLEVIVAHAPRRGVVTAQIRGLRPVPSATREPDLAPGREVLPNP